MIDNGLPGHIAIIMDGNGRWAKTRGRERLYGHTEGMESVNTIVRACGKIGIEYLTLYAFSKENWGRPQEEVEGLMEIFCLYARNETPELKKNNTRIHFIGDTGTMGEKVREAMDYCMRETANCTGLNVVIAVNYGARWEITEAARTIAAEAVAGTISLEDIDMKLFAKNLTTKNIPDPDLLIRTSGECRLSNFLLWQAAYSELYFTETLWPDFREKDLMEAIEAYRGRNRRFGLI